jgi:adenosylcobinamide-GDP ribazoletransferase
MTAVRRALSFLTPLGGASRPSGSALLWFPFLGAALGLALGGIWWAATRAWSAPVAAAVVVAADLGLTGLLHLDGLADSADGLLPHLSRERRLAVMAEPAVGAFGVGVVGVVLLLRFAALTGLRPSWLLLGGLWCASRTWMAVAARALPYARSQGGLASAFLEGPGRPAVVGAIGLAGSCALLLAWHPVAGAVSLASATLAAGGVLLLAWRRVGGFTGDVLGASGLVGETVGLLVAAARW